MDIKNLKLLPTKAKVGFTLAEGATHVNLLPTSAKVGFTLAEVLITLGIIGVVAAMTIPSLINNYKAARLKSQFLKSYSTIQQVFKRMQDDEISVDPSSYTDGGSFQDVFMKYLSGAQKCSLYQTLCKFYDVTTGSIVYKGIHYYYLNDGTILLNDGTLLMFENQTNSSIVWVTVDLNGVKNPPNIEGYDTFTFQLIDGELHTMGDIGSAYVGETYCDIDKIIQITKNNKSAIGDPYGMSCAHYAKVDADYFKKVVRKYKY